MHLLLDGLIFQRQKCGGISRIFHEILPEMCDLDPDFSVTIINERSYGDLQQKLPQHTAIKSHFTRRMPSILKYVSSWRTRNSLWHSTYYTRTPLYKDRRVVTVYDMVYEKLPQIYGTGAYEVEKMRKRNSILQADCLITISETTKQDVCEEYGISPDNAYSIPLAASELFRKVTVEEKQLPENLRAKSFILYVGTRSGHKNFRTLLDAYREWHHQKDVLLLVVGPVWTDEERQYLTESGLSGQIYLLQQIDDGQLRNLYNVALAFVYPSLYEGFGIPVLEAMRCGCPVVASRIPTTEEIAQSYPFYFAPTSVESLTNALTNAIEEKQNTNRLQRGIEHALQYNWRKTAQSTLDVYRTLNV